MRTIRNLIGFLLLLIALVAELACWWLEVVSDALHGFANQIIKE